MKCIKTVLSISLLSLFAANSVGGDPPGNSTEHKVLIDASKHYQTLEGWGSSLCWWAGEVGNWEEERIDSLVELFTSPNGLNMNIFRYNIGGGDDPSHLGGHMVKGKGKRAEMEGFKPSEEAPYNWKADAAQRRIMLKIKEKRPDAVFEAFSNSPPYWMTISGCSAGHQDPGKDNLAPTNYAAFCDYLIDVCKHYKDVYDIEFKTLEPFNEPTSRYWNYMGSQEGCHFDAESQMELIRLLDQKLKQGNLKTMISASDETSIRAFNAVLTKYLDENDILDKLGQLNTHSYNGSNEDRVIAYRLVDPIGKQFWQSETGPMGLPRRAKGLENNLLLCEKLFNDMRYMKPQAWLDWQLMEENNDVWGLVECDFETEKYTLHKNLYIRMQITRLFKQGCTFIQTDHDFVLAAQNPGEDEWVVAVVNSNTTDRIYEIEQINLPEDVAVVAAYRTSETENCDKISIVSNKDNMITYTSPGLSLTTFVLRRK